MKKIKNLRQYQSVSDRRIAVEEELEISLKNIGEFSLNEQRASTLHCENMIGAAQIPLGVAGPLKISNLKEQISTPYIPLATTEGALVASISRGCKAISESGGAIATSNLVGTTRGPVFKVGSLLENRKLADFFQTHFSDLKTITEKTSGHLTLTKISSTAVGRYHYARFHFDTQDAMGMNMVTIATSAAVAFIEEKTNVVCVSVAGNFDVDKKPSWLNFIEGRGMKVWAEAIISEGVLKKNLKTTAPALYETWYAKCMLGTAMSGSMGFNSHFANVIAAIFIATGQDPAHIVEGSLGVTTTEIVSGSTGKGKDLHISIYLPNLMVGTVGGGTPLATQREALELLGVFGGKNGENAQKFAEIIAGAVLAGELSLLASLTEGSLAKSHLRLGRGKQ